MKVIVISGSMGAGKTTVMAEAPDLLAANGIAHAAIDADTLGIVHLPGTFVDRHHVSQSRGGLEHFAAAGVNRLLLAEAVEQRGEIERIRRVVPSVRRSRFADWRPASRPFGNGSGRAI